MSVRQQILDCLERIEDLLRLQTGRPPDPPASQPLATPEPTEPDRAPTPEPQPETEEPA